MLFAKLKHLLKDGIYTRASVVLMLEISLSTFASLLSFLLLGAITEVDQGSDRFILGWLLVSLISSAFAFRLIRTHSSAVRYSNLWDYRQVFLALMVKAAFLCLYIFFIGKQTRIHLGAALLDFLISVTLLLLAKGFVVMLYQSVRERTLASLSRTSLLIEGIGESSRNLALYLKSSEKYRVLGFLTVGETDITTLSDLPVYRVRNALELSDLKEKLNFSAVLFADQDQVKNREGDILDWLLDLGLKPLIHTPAVELSSASEPRPNFDVRNIKIEDLLGRSEIKVSLEDLTPHFSEKTILVTGGAGSIGSELCRQLSSLGVKQLIIYDNAETPVHEIRRQLERRYPHLDLKTVVGDVRLLSRLDFVFKTYRPQIVFHAAAYKHVPLMEENPCEAILVNTVGSKNVADKCVEYGVETMVMVSTDKAVNPTNVMGCSKRLAEIYIQSLGLAIEQGSISGNTRFVTTRFGNVLGSNGSVIPLFQEQIERGGPVTVTHPDITRFFMTIPEACRLVMEAAHLTNGNQIFVFDMGKSMKILDLAKRMIELAGYQVDKDIKIEFSGLRPGEKLYEEVLSNEENTIPTQHTKIRVAKVRDYEYGHAQEALAQLEDLAREINVIGIVKLMKCIVPEYISRNSEFEKYD